MISSQTSVTSHLLQGDTDLTVKNDCSALPQGRRLSPYPYPGGMAGVTITPTSESARWERFRTGRSLFGRGAGEESDAVAKRNRFARLQNDRSAAGVGDIKAA